MKHLDYVKILEKIGAEKDVSKLTEEELLFYDMVQAIRSKSADDEKIIIKQAINQLKQQQGKTISFNTIQNRNTMKTNNRTWIGIAAGIAILVVAYFFISKPSKTPEEIFNDSFKTEQGYVQTAVDKASQYGMVDVNSESRDSFLRAMNFYQNNQYDEAMKLLSPYVVIYPDDHMARFHLAMCQMNRERYSPALENLSILNATKDLEFAADVKWYLALCYLKMVDGKKQAGQLFKQLADGNDKYHKQAKENLNYLKNYL